MATGTDRMVPIMTRLLGLPMTRSYTTSISAILGRQGDATAPPAMICTDLMNKGLSEDQSRSDSCFQFLDLPAEIRELIYTYHFANSVITFETYPQTSYTGPKKPPFWIHTEPQNHLLLTCKQIHEEAKHYLYEANHIHLIGIDAFKFSGQYMARNRRHHTRRLTGASAHGDYRYSALVKYFPRVEEVQFKFRPIRCHLPSGRKFADITYRHLRQLVSFNAFNNPPFTLEQKVRGGPWKSFTMSTYLHFETVVDLDTMEEMGSMWSRPEGEDFDVGYEARSFKRMEFLVPAEIDFVNEKLTQWWDRRIDISTYQYGPFPKLDGESPSAIARAEFEEYRDDITPLLQRYAKFLDYDGIDAKHIKPKKMKRSDWIALKNGNNEGIVIQSSWTEPAS